MTKTGKAFVIERNDLQTLFDVLIDRGYVPVGPTVRDGAIVYDELRSVDDLPEGWTEEQDAGTYRVVFTLSNPHGSVTDTLSVRVRKEREEPVAKGQPGKD